MIAKIDAYENTSSDNTATPPLFIPTNELPPMMQTVVAEQFKGMQAHPDSFNGNSTLRIDGVNLMVGTRSMYIIPGMPHIPAKIDGVSDLSPHRFHDKPSYLLARRSPDTSLPTIAFSPHCPNRALLIAPHNADELTHAVLETRRAGFNQLWVQMPRGETALLTEAIRLGKANGLSVRAVVRPLQATPTDAPTTFDRTLLSETTTAYAKRKRAALRQAGISDEEPTDDWRSGGSYAKVGRGNPGEWRHAAVANRLLLRGDYLRSDDLAMQQQIIADLSKMAATPGLSGLVLRDVAPVGYPRIPPMGEAMMMVDGVDPIYDPLLALGYTESMRLACLRKNGFDPIDLSTLPQGDRIAPSTGTEPGRGSAQPVSIELPFFHDLGVSAHYTFRGSGNDMVRSGEMTGARDSLTRWKTFRSETADAFLQNIAAGVHATCPDIPIASSTEGQLGHSALWFANFEASNVQGPATSATSVVAASPPGSYISSNKNPLQIARAEAKNVYKLVSFGAIATDPTIANAEALQRLQYGLDTSNGWDGVVVDLTYLSPERAEAVLHVMPNAAPPSDVP